MEHLKKFAKNLIVLLFWLGVWAILARLAASPLLLPSPWEVLRKTAELAAQWEFWRTCARSLGRIFAGAAAGVVLGALLAVFTQRYRLLRALLSPVMAAVRSTPVASFIILALVWMGRDVLPAFIAALMVLPVIWANVGTGIESTNHDLLEVARVFGFGRARTAVRVYIPSVMPYFISACRSALGLGWKAGIAAEVLTVPVLSIGRMLYESKLYLETTDLFAWTLVVIVCSMVIDTAVMAAIGRLGKKYRWEAAHDRDK